MEGRHRWNLPQGVNPKAQGRVLRTLGNVPDSEILPRRGCIAQFPVMQPLRGKRASLRHPGCRYAATLGYELQPLRGNDEGSFDWT